MTNVSFVDLVVRMVVSLGIVLGLMYGAYWFMRRRQGFGPTETPKLVRTFARLANKQGAMRTSGARVPGNRRGLRVLGRVGVGRTSQVVAVQFADKVLLMAAGDTSAPTVIAEMELEAWRAATEAADEDAVSTIAPIAPMAPIVRESIDPSRPRPTGFVDALREATTRRG